MPSLNRRPLPLVAARFQPELIERADRWRRHIAGRQRQRLALLAQVQRRRIGRSGQAPPAAHRTRGPASRSARSCGLRVGRVPDVHRLEVRAIRVGIADALHDRQLPVFQQRRHALQARMQADAVVDLEHAALRRAPGSAGGGDTLRRRYGTTVFRPSLPPLSCTTTRILLARALLGPIRGRFEQKPRRVAARAKPSPRPTRRPKRRPGTCGGKWSCMVLCSSVRQVETPAANRARATVCFSATGRDCSPPIEPLDQAAREHPLASGTATSSSLSQSTIAALDFRL